MFKKLLFLLFLLVYNYSFSQPPVPGGPNGNGTPGAQATPIDEYSFYLIGIAIIVAVVYYTINKYKKSLI